MIEIRDGVSRADIVDILRTPRQDEIEMPDHDGFFEWFDDSVTVGGTLVKDGCPIAAWGASTRPGYTSLAWLISRPGLERHAVRLVKRVKAEIEVHKKPIYATIHPRNARNQRWIRYLGFVHTWTDPNTGYDLFVKE